MAKSYVTQFTEYMANQRDKFETALINKGFPVDKNASIGNMVSLLSANTELTYDYVYERDKNFPDIDTMFDNDILRAVNGGEHKYCIYSICQIPPSGTIYFPYNYYVNPTNSDGLYTGYYKEVHIGNGDSNDIVVEIPTSSKTGSPTVTKYTLSEEELNTHTFIGEDDKKYTLVRIYYYNERPQNAYTYVPGHAVEVIWDGGIVIKSLSEPSGMGADSYRVTVRYARYPMSNATQTDLYNNSSTTSISLAGEISRLDGQFRATTITATGSKALLYGEYVPSPSYTSGYVSMSIGTSGTNSVASMFAEYVSDLLVTPYSSVPLYISTGGTTPKNVIIREGTVQVAYLKQSSYGGNSTFKHATKIILPSTIEIMTSTPGSELIDIDVAVGAFNDVLNKGAHTIDFSTCYNLKKESIINFFNNIADRTGKTANIVKIPKQINVKLTAEEKEIATNKNWTISVGSY